MTNTKKALAKLEDALAEVVDRRSETYSNRSERWQESERGEVYQELTDRLIEMLDDVRDWNCELDEY